MADDGSIALPQTLTLDHVSPATRLLEKRRQMFEVQEALDAQKEEFARREEAFRRREEGLRKKDLDLQESLIRFNKFLQENESKRTRAEKRANDEFKARTAKEAGVRTLQDKYKAEKSELAKLQAMQQAHKKYQDFLEEVVNHHQDDYQEIANVVQRFEVLNKANEEMEQRQKDIESRNEAKREQFFKFKKEMTNDILNCNNLIAKLKKKLEHVEIETQEHQKAVDKAIEDQRDRSLVLGRVLMAVENLLQRCIRNPYTTVKGHPVIKHVDTTAAGEEGAGGGGGGGGGGTGAAAGAGGGEGEEGDGEEEDFDIATATPAQVAARGKRALHQLGVIASYIIDFDEVGDRHDYDAYTFEKGGAAARERTRPLAGTSLPGGATGAGSGGGGASSGGPPSKSTKGGGVNDSRVTNSTTRA